MEWWSASHHVCLKKCHYMQGAPLHVYIVKIQILLILVSNIFNFLSLIQKTVFYFLRNLFSTDFSFKIFEPFIASHTKPDRLSKTLGDSHRWRGSINLPVAHPDHWFNTYNNFNDTFTIIAAAVFFRVEIKTKLFGWVSYLQALITGFRRKILN